MKNYVLVSILLISYLPLWSQKSGFKEGYYILNDSTKIEGLINYGFSDSKYFRFQKTQDDEVIKILPDDCIGFSFDKKNFVVLANFNIKAGLWDLVEPKDFVEVFIVGKVNLYKDYTSIGYPPTYIENFLLTKEGSPDVILAHPNAKKFSNELSLFFSDFNELSQKIKKKELGYYEIISIVIEYNAYWNKKEGTSK